MSREQLLAHLKAQRLWQSTDSLLIAVSGGVDSMVLLDLMIHLSDTYHKCGVAYVDHQLREQSKVEKQFVKQVCQRYDIPFFHATWTPTETNVEANARAFRYDFFESLLATENYDGVLTAHHLNDQAETLVMKLIREGTMFALKSLVATQSFGVGKRLIRPLLTLEKKTLRQYAADYQIEYYEDLSNQDDQYTRNRVRKYLIPQMIDENPQALVHIDRVSQQVALAEQLIQENYHEWARKWIIKTPTSWCIALKGVGQLSKAQAYYFWECLRLDSHSLLTINQKQLAAVQELIRQNKSQWQLTLKNQGIIKRRYDKLWLIANEQALPIVEHGPLRLIINQSYSLSENELIGIFEPDHLPDWQADYQLRLSAQTEFWLRKRQPGDKIALTPKLSKKVARYLIDAKIPKEARDRAWILENKDKNLLAFLPFVCSYLSISKETDKIHYVLLYKYEK